MIEEYIDLSTVLVLVLIGKQKRREGQSTYINLIPSYSIESIRVPEFFLPSGRSVKRPPAESALPISILI